MDEATTKLAEIVGQVLEQQAFMFAEPCAREELEDGAGTYMQASIDFSGPVDGTLAIAVPTEFGVELAANVLGIEAEEVDADDMAQDALKELLNVVCGQVLTELYGSGLVFQLSIPTARQIDEGEWEELKGQEAGVGFLIDDENPALVNLAMERVER